MSGIIMVREKGPIGALHRVLFDALEEAQSAFSHGVQFWVDFDHAAFVIKAEGYTLAVAADIIASISVYQTTEGSLTEKPSKDEVEKPKPKKQATKKTAPVKKLSAARARKR